MGRLYHRARPKSQIIIEDAVRLANLLLMGHFALIEANLDKYNMGEDYTPASQNDTPIYAWSNIRGIHYNAHAI